MNKPVTADRASMRWFTALAAAAAFLYNYPCGFRMFEPFAGFIVFDGGHRILCGQLPYRDFFAPTGPVLFWLQAAMFKILGVSHWAYVTTASLMNLAGTVCAMGTCWRLCRNPRWVLIAGLITAVWYVPIKALPWYTNGAFLFLFIAMRLVVDPAGQRGRLGRNLLAGVAVSLSFYCKQPIGTVGGIFLALYLLQGMSFRRAIEFSCGCAMGLAALTAAWAGMGGWDNVMRYNFLLPMGWAHDSMRASLSWLWVGGITMAGLPLFRRREWGLWALTALLLYSTGRTMDAALAFLLPLLALVFMQDLHDRALLMALSLMQCLAAMSSQDVTFQHWPFLGIQLVLAWKGLRAWWSRHALGALGERIFGFPWRFSWVLNASATLTLFMGVRYSLLWRLSGLWFAVPVMSPLLGLSGVVMACALLFAAFKESCRGWSVNAVRIRRLSLAAMLCLSIGAAGLAQGIRIYRKKTRSITLDAFSLESHRRPLHAHRLDGLIVHPTEADVLKDAWTYLATLPRERRPFFVYPTHLFLHGLFDEPPPQPFLWFEPGLSYANGEPDEPRLCGSLRRRSVQTIMVVGSAENLSKIPCLRALVDNEFEVDYETGSIHGFRRKTS